MAQASYKLATLLCGRMHYAEVTVTAGLADEPSIRVSPAAFSWLSEAYGPDAREWPICDAYRAAAISGAGYALQHVAGEEGTLAASVVIDCIHASTADTSPDDVAYAAVLATWNALGVKGSVEPALPNDPPAAPGQKTPRRES